MPKINKKIFLVAGGTGGHLFPAIAVAQKDKKINISSLLIAELRKFYKKYDFFLFCCFLV